MQKRPKRACKTTCSLPIRHFAGMPLMKARGTDARIFQVFVNL